MEVENYFSSQLCHFIRVSPSTLYHNTDVDVKRGSMIYGELACYPCNAIDKGLNLRTRNKKPPVTTDTADIRARRMGDIFPLLRPKARTFVAMAVAVATLC